MVGMNVTGNLVQGNYIGPDISGGGPLGNNGTGVKIDFGAYENVIGGTTAAASNVISGHTGSGVGIMTGQGGPGTGNAVLRNLIFSNDGLGIDLNLDGATPNDPGDSDTGPNDLQNCATLTAACNVGGTVTIEGSLNSAASTEFTLEFFTASQFGLAGNGGAKTFLGSATVTTNSNGVANFVVNLAASGGFIQAVTATVTDQDNNTSELSNVRPIGSPILYLVDDRNGNCLRLLGNSYVFRAAGRTYTGPAVITETATKVTFQSAASDPNYLTGSADITRRNASARFQAPRGGTTIHNIFDSNTENNGICP
jgi:hypothetical protein